jgi:hypothetical protein
LLDLGVVDGHLEFFPPEMQCFGKIETRAWLRQLSTGEPFAISERGLSYLRGCQVANAEFGLRLEPGGALIRLPVADTNGEVKRGARQWQLRLGAIRDRHALVQSVKSVPFSPMLIEMIGKIL